MITAAKESSASLPLLPVLSSSCCSRAIILRLITFGERENFLVNFVEPVGGTREAPGSGKEVAVGVEEAPKGVNGLVTFSNLSADVECWRLSAVGSPFLLT